MTSSDAGLVLSHVLIVNFFILLTSNLIGVFIYLANFRCEYVATSLVNK